MLVGCQGTARAIGFYSPAERPIRDRLNVKCEMAHSFGVVDGGGDSDSAGYVGVSFVEALVPAAKHAIRRLWDLLTGSALIALGGERSGPASKMAPRQASS